MQVSVASLQILLESVLRRPLQDFELNASLSDLSSYDSMAALSFYILISEELTVSLSMEDFLACSTLSDLHDLLEAKS